MADKKISVRDCSHEALLIINERRAKCMACGLLHNKKMVFGKERWAMDRQSRMAIRMREMAENGELD